MDRGSWSVEVILALLAFKVLYPGALHLTRGNHEAKSMNTIYGARVGGRAGVSVRVGACSVHACMGSSRCAVPCGG